MQTAHDYDMATARAGMKADTGYGDTISRLSEESAGAAAGTYVCPGTDPETQAVLPAAAVDITDGDGLGVVRYDSSKEPARTAAAVADGNEYDDEQSLPLMRKGRIWVLCDAAASIAFGDAVYVRYVAGAGGTKLGTFRQNVDTASAALLPNAQFRSAHKDVALFGTTQRIALLEISGV